MIVFGHDVHRLFPDLRREIDQVFLAHALNVDRRRFGRKRLCLRQALAGHGRCGDLPLLDRPHGLAGDAVEHVDKGLLGDLRNRLDRFSADCDVDQGWRGRRVVIPHAMMDELIVPDLFAGRRIKADEAVAIKAVPQAVAAVIIVGRRTHRQIDVTQFLVRAHRRPDIGVAGFLPGVLLPGLDAGLALLRHGMKGPEQFAGHDVKSPDIAGR